MPALNSGKLLRMFKGRACAGCGAAIAHGDLYWDDRTGVPHWQSGYPYHRQCALDMAIVDEAMLTAGEDHRIERQTMLASERMTIAVPVV